MKIKNTARNIAYGATLASLLCGLGSCNYESNKENVPSQNYSLKVQTEQYDLESFKRLPAMKGRLEDLTQEKKIALEEMFNGGDKTFKKAVYTIYENPKKYYDEILTDKFRKEYDTFDPKQIPEKDLKAILGSLPWKINMEKLTESDKAVLFALYGMKDFKVGKIF